MRWILVLVMACSVASAERLRARDGTVREVPDQSVNYALQDGYTRIPRVMMRAPDGDIYEVDEDGVAFKEGEGWWKMTDAEIRDYRRDTERASRARIDSEIREEELADSRRQTYVLVGIGIVITVLVTFAVIARSSRTGKK